MERQEREVTDDGAAWRAVVARRGPSRHALLYFLPLGDDGPLEDDRRDRRNALGPGTDLAGLEEDDLRSRLAEAAPLTDTERRFRAPDGRLWLAQSSGPVWADGGVAEGLTGVVFTSLEGRPERLTAGGGHVGRMAASELDRRWRAAAGGEDDESAASAGPDAAAETGR